jgi:hypothetical protein
VNAAAWAGSAAGIIVIGTCAALLYFAGRHAGRVHQRARPYVYRLIIFGMYVGACAVVLTALGAYVTGVEFSLIGLAGNVSAGLGHEIVVIAGVVFILATVLGFFLEPYPAVAWFALATPFVVALSGGHLHGALTVFPVNEWAAQVSQWIGG